MVWKLLCNECVQLRVFPQPAGRTSIEEKNHLRRVVFESKKFYS
jgi:hypothetical protein